MTLEQLRTEFLRLCRNPTINDSYDLLNIFADYFLQSVTNDHRYSPKTNAERDAKMVNQMMLTKTLHISQIVQAVTFKSSDGTFLNDIIDPTVVAVLIRNVYETVCMFNIVYRYTKTEDEKLILYNLWVISGLKYRQKFAKIAATSENTDKLSDEKKIIDDLIHEIHETNLYKGLDQNNQEEIRKIIKKKDYKIRFDNNKVIALNWQQLSETAGIAYNLFDEIYTYLSLYAHPTNVAVFQFGNMFFDETRQFLDFTSYNLKSLFLLLSVFIADYINIFPYLKTTFESQPLINQLVINGFNKTCRGENYSINETWKLLG